MTEIHPLAAWQQRKGMTLRQLHDLITGACVRRGIQIPAIGTLRNVLGRQYHAGARWIPAIVDATEGEVTADAVLAFQAQREGRAA